MRTKPLRTFIHTKNIMAYQRFLTPASAPYDPLELAKATEDIVTREGLDGQQRKYSDFYSVPVYGGIATGYAVGCCLRCGYCWTNWSRDFPETLGTFYSPSQVAQWLIDAAEEGITRWDRYQHLTVDKLRISGCEPTIGKRHLLAVLDCLKDSGYPFYLETNGVLFGADEVYVKELREYADFLYVRVSLKAATPEGFTERTGAKEEYYDLPFKALEHLQKADIFVRPAAMTDPTIMPEKERHTLIARLNKIESRLGRMLEEETIDSYSTTQKRLRAHFDAEYAEELKKELTRRYGK